MCIGLKKINEDNKQEMTMKKNSKSGYKTVILVVNTNKPNPTKMSG